MNLVAIQLANELKKYISRYEFIKDKYSDVEYLLWLSMEYGESDWPTTGEFPDARKDNEFRELRLSYKKVDLLLEQISTGVIEYDRQIEYRKKFMSENPDRIPF